MALESGSDASYEFYHACLDRLDILITERNSVVGKNEVVQILRVLSYFRPREFERAEKLRKQAGHVTRSEMQDDFISVRHKELIKKNAAKSRTLPSHVFSFISDNVRSGAFRNMFTQFDEEQESKLATSLYDVMALYIQVYDNLQVRVVDMAHLFDAQEALDVLVSFSISEEGSNNMYIAMIECMLTKRDASTYDMVEIEMILNYFPHIIWASEDQLKPLRDKFYAPILQNIHSKIDGVENRQLVALFQGMCLCGPNAFDRDLLNLFLNQFVKRLQAPAENTDEQLTTLQVFQFLEILIVYLKANRSIQYQINSQQLLKLCSERHLKQACPTMHFTQISSVYWLYAYLDEEWSDLALLAQLEGRVVELLEKEIQLQRTIERESEKEIGEGLQTMSVEDVSTIENFYQKSEELRKKSQNLNKVLKLIEDAKYWHKSEKDRKWFHF